MIALALVGLVQQPKFSFVAIPRGAYKVGKADLLDNPLRKVRLEAFEISKYDVTNAQFAEFVKATHYVTEAETRHNAMVFEPPLPEFRWIHDRTAYWRFPNGIKRGGIEGKMDHPVTSISYVDAEAYCKWAGARLPSLVEWEVACRAGTKTDYFFGNSPDPIGKYANVWHGRDHLKPDYSDGYMYTSPVGHFLPNPLGLYDMYGNVFQFCAGRTTDDNPSIAVHARGGSWWCSRNSCCSFNSADIGTVNRHASFSNQGFRVARTMKQALNNGGPSARR
jgi:sulfatase modifying factor 1